MGKSKIRSSSPLWKKARRGFRGFPVATVALYGPDDKLATKVAVGIAEKTEGPIVILERWFSDGPDIREDMNVEMEIVEFIRAHAVKSVIVTDGIIGCPHEEGKDYPDGQKCPHCPFWSFRNRWTGEVIE